MSCGAAGTVDDSSCERAGRRPQATPRLFRQRPKQRREDRRNQSDHGAETRRPPRRRAGRGVIGRILAGKRGPHNGKNVARLRQTHGVQEPVSTFTVSGVRQAAHPGPLSRQALAHTSPSSALGADHRHLRDGLQRPSGPRVEDVRVHVPVRPETLLSRSGRGQGRVPQEDIGNAGAGMLRSRECRLATLALRGRGPETVDTAFRPRNQGRVEAVSLAGSPPSDRRRTLCRCPRDRVPRPDDRTVPSGVPASSWTNWCPTCLRAAASSSAVGTLPVPRWKPQALFRGPTVMSNAPSVSAALLEADATSVGTAQGIPQPADARPGG